MKSAVNVVCLKWGDKYPAEYVNRLYRMVNKHLTLPFDFYCITENTKGLYSEVQVIPLPFEEGLTGWWYKLQLFKKGNYGIEGKILFMDLDTVIVNNIDALFQYPDDKFLIIKDLQKGKIYNSSVFCFESGYFAYVWDQFEQDKQAIMARLYGDQDWISEVVEGAELWPNDWVVSFKKQCNARAKRSFGVVGQWLRSMGFLLPKGEATYPESAKIVYFHGKPDPDDVFDRPYGMWKKASWIERSWQ
ncbi:MAG: hypothetical protein OXE99_15380 [Cellvibrionales bacterium]|nr:hypothetical protein [Cellvibrionales bacterium]